MKATEFLKQDHAAVSELIAELVRAADGSRRQELMDALTIALEVHAQLEEELFYPSLAALSGLIPEARREHARMRNLIQDMDRRSAPSPDFLLKIGELGDMVRRHVAEEEQAIFAEAEQLGADELEMMGRHLEDRKQVLMTAAATGELRARKIA